MASTSETRVVPEMMNVYQDLLAKNTANYSSILGAYAGGQQNLNAQLPSIYQTYSDLGKGLEGSYDRSYTAAARDIQRSNTFNLGKVQQSMIGRGLGGSTAFASAARGVGEDSARQYEHLGATIGQQKADAARSVGLAGLAARMQGLGLQTGLQQNMAGTLAGYQGFTNRAGQLLGGFSRSDAGGGGGGSFPSMMGGGGGGMGGGGGPVGGLESMLRGLGGGLGLGGGGGSSGMMGPAGPQVAFGGTNPFGGGMMGGMGGSPAFTGFTSNTGYGSPMDFVNFDQSYMPSDGWGFDEGGFGGGGEF